MKVLERNVKRRILIQENDLMIPLSRSAFLNCRAAASYRALVL
jgi:hypothetical protein